MKSNLTDKRFHCIPRYTAVIMATLLLFIGCAEVPITQRKSLKLMPGNQLLTLSLQQYNELLKKSKLSTEQAKVQMVRSVGEKIARSAEAFLRDSGRENLIKNYKWEFRTSRLTSPRR